MKNRCPLFLSLGGLGAAVLAFLLFSAGALVLEPETSAARFFLPAAGTSLAGLLALTLGVLRAERTPALTGAWAYCGGMAALGGGGGFLTALLASLIASRQLYLWIGASLCCFFLTLLSGGLLCFLRRYTAGFYCSAAVRRLFD